MEDTTKNLQDMYISCHNIAKEAYTALESLHRRRPAAAPLARAARARAQPALPGSYPLEFGSEALH